MRHRLPLLRPLTILVVLFVLTAVAVFGFLRFDRVVTAAGRFAGESAGAPTRFEGWLDDHGRVAVRAGQPAAVRADALPWLQHGAVAGRVDSVGAYVPGSGFAVVVVLNGGDAGKGPAPLAVGMAGQARIRVGAPVSLGDLLFERLAGGGQP